MPAKKSSIDTTLIRDLAKLLNEEELSEIEVEEDDMRIRLSRGGGTMTMQSVVAPAPALAAQPAVTPQTAATPAEAVAITPTGNGEAVGSPMVGTAYHSPSPGADAFVSVGASVKKGQTVMIIEAMKTMNQIPAPRDGVVASIDIEDGQPVEFGQSLITLE